MKTEFNSMTKKQHKEANDIVHYLLPKLSNLGFNFEVDSATINSGRLRGDCWLLDETNKIGLIEAKPTDTVIGDMNWKDAMRQGRLKATIEQFPFYVVTNCKQYTRFYNSETDEEISIDMLVITNFVTLDVFKKLCSKITKSNSNLSTSSTVDINTHTQYDFSNTLKLMRNKYRGVGIDNDKLISPTISFIIIKYISELESELRTLPKHIKLWDDFPKDNIRDGVLGFVNNLWKEEEYSGNKYFDFKNLINFPSELTNVTYTDIYKELSSYHFHGGMPFDIFGSVYEEYATKTAKQEFGEYYTRRHITTIAAQMLLMDVSYIAKDLKIGDPACGTGGFLTEAFQYLNSKTKNKEQKELLKKNTFYGYDSNKESINRTKLNMFLSGDGHNNIHHIKDSLEWNDRLGWSENSFDYILANPPMGKYDGSVDTNTFNYSSKKRMETLFLEKIVQSLKIGGKACIVVNDGPLENPTFSDFRKNLLFDVQIKSIVSLNKWVFAPYTKEKTYLVFIEKKEKEQMPTGEIKISHQSEPIYHFILDYDGFAASDNRYRTKYHDDIPELETQLTYLFSGLKPETRMVNSVEKLDDLHGWKSKFISMDQISNNKFILTSEKYLRSEQNIDFEELSALLDSKISKIKDLL